MKKAAQQAAEKGLDLHVHAIGDLAVDRVLDLFCGLGETAGTKTIAHNQLYMQKDIEKISRAGDIFFQSTPHWVALDEYTEKHIGPERYYRQFPFGTMIRKGVTVSFGSDSCLDPETSSAFLGMYYAEARGDEKLCASECFPPVSEGITRMDSLAAYTLNGAAQLGISDVTRMQKRFFLLYRQKTV